MAIDPTRYGFVTQEYRWNEVTDATLKANYAAARELEIPANHTSLSESLLLATAMFAVVGGVRRRFEIVLSGTVSINVDQFSDRPPTVTFTCAKLGVSALTCIITRCTVDDEEDITILEAWG